uniref:Unannotated protein n=1 Tax=freshwater metagenome TaxID=449393 RepID=A0A6J7PLZ7_9ZZZZ
MTATIPSGMSVSSSQTLDMTTMSTVPAANGNGERISVAMSTSTPALAMRSPDWCRWCHRSGWETRRSTTDIVRSCATLHFTMPANVLRSTTPTARTRPIQMTSMHPVTTAPTATRPSRNRGRIT